MSDPESAGQFLHEHLPPDVAALLSDDPPELQSGSFVDEELAPHQTDLLFRIKLKDGGEALAYVLVEHKSAPDRLARLQLLRYVTRVLVQWHRENKRLPLPAVVPLLAHHGPSGWSISPDFEEMYGRVASPLRPYLVSFRHALVDLARIDDHALSQHLRLRAFLKALKYILRADLAEHLESLLADAPDLDRMDLVLVLKYIVRGPVDVSPQIVQRVLQRLMREREEMAKRFTEDMVEGLLEEVRRNVRQELKEKLEKKFQQALERIGLEEGQAIGKASSLIQVLEVRFGPLTPDYRDRIISSDVTSVEAWLTKAVQAPDLNAVFE